jgi:hypothetical protein
VVRIDVAQRSPPGRRPSLRRSRLATIHIPRSNAPLGSPPGVAELRGRVAPPRSGAVTVDVDKACRFGLDPAAFSGQIRAPETARLERFRQSAGRSRPTSAGLLLPFRCGSLASPTWPIETAPFAGCSSSPSGPRCSYLSSVAFATTSPKHFRNASGRSGRMSSGAPRAACVRFRHAAAIRSERLRGSHCGGAAVERRAVDRRLARCGEGCRVKCGVVLAGCAAALA